MSKKTKALLYNLICFAVIFISVLLVIISTGFVRIMAAEQRRAIDDDLANRALFAAETGAEDAIVKIRKSIVNGPPLNGTDLNKCADGELSGSADYDISYTCQIIESDVKNLTFELPVEGSREIDLSGIGGLNKVRVEWHLQNISKDGPINNLAGLNVNSSSTYWLNQKIPALMRINAITYPSGGFNTGTIGNNVMFVYPVTNGASIPQLDITDPGTSSGSAACSPSAADDVFACRADITGLGAGNTIVKLTALQRGAWVRVTALNNSNQIIDLPGNIYSIDSTGRSGDVLRRVRMTAQFTSSGAGGSSAGDVLGRNFVITDQSICKDFGYDNTNGKATDNAGCY